MSDQQEIIPKLDSALDKAMSEFEVLKDQMKSLASAIEIKEIEETDLESAIIGLENVLAKTQEGIDASARFNLELNELEEEERKLQAEMLLCVPKTSSRRVSASSIATASSQGDLSQDIDEPNSELQNFEATMNEEINWEYPEAGSKK